jgi:FAD/FMN-containing dehydrogenase
LHTSRSNADIALMKQLKSTLDPKNILNRDKVFET